MLKIERLLVEDDIQLVSFAVAWFIMTVAMIGILVEMVYV